MFRTLFSYQAWPRIIPCLCVLLGTLMSSVGFCVVTHHLAGRARKDGLFLPTDRPIMIAEALVACAMEYATNSSEANDVLFLGDSTCAFSVIPTSFQQRTGLRAYNLGSCGYIGMNCYAVMLRVYLEHHPRPRLIVYCVHPTIFARQSPVFPSLHDRFMDVYGSKTTSGRAFSLDPRRISDEFILAMREFRGRRDYRDVPINHTDLAAVPSEGAMTYGSFFSQVLKRRGYYHYPSRVRSGALESCNPERYSVATQALEDLNEVIRVSSEHGIPLVIRLAPIPSGTEACCPTNLDDSLRALEAIKDTKVAVSWPSVLQYDAACFWCDLGATHCNEDGAAKFTGFVAEEVMKILAEGRDRRG